MYGPPVTDSEDEDYDGFYFGDDHIKKNRSHWVTDPEDDLYKAAEAGNLNELIKQVDMLQFNINDTIKGDLTLLHVACRNGHFDIVKYLLDNKANPNRQLNAVTPLMEACSHMGENGQNIPKIVKMLLEHDAVINVSDRYGMTPFMFACKNGHLEVARWLIKDSYLEAQDNCGWTAIFFAIESNKIDIVNLLIANGIDTNVVNKKGYTPRQFAQFHGFNDILAILPPEVYKYTVSVSFLYYNSLRDHIPRIFLKSEIPEYFQEITGILASIGMDSFIGIFAQKSICLAEFLVMDNDKLKELGVELPIHRNKIQIALLNFHMNHWQKRLIGRVKRNEPDSFYDILMISANHLQNLIVLNSTIKFIKQSLESNKFGDITTKQLDELRQAICSYRKSIKDLTKTTKYLQSFSPPKSPIYIDYDEYVYEKKKFKMKRVFKYTLFISISIVICLKFKRII